MSQEYIKYSDSTTAAAIDAMSSVLKEVDAALSGAQNALSTLRSLESAGGDLVSLNGGTIIGEVTGGIAKLTDGVSRIKKIVDKLNTVREIMAKSKEWGKGPMEYKTEAGTVVDLVESVCGAYDAYLKGDQDAMIVEILDAGFDIAAGQVGDPLAAYLLSNGGDGVGALQTASDYSDNMVTELAEQYHQGEIGIGGYFGGALGGGLTNSVIAITDATTNILGFDIIPDSWVSAATEAGKTWGTSAGHCVDLAFDRAVSTGKELFTAGKSLFERLMN